MSAVIGQVCWHISPDIWVEMWFPIATLDVVLSVGQKDHSRKQGCG